MIERVKTGVLIALVVLSLLQSYLLAYSMPGLVATVRSDLDYINAERLGTTSHVENTIFPEELIIHMGEDRHTVLYPNTQFYEMILEERLMGREFKGFQRSPITLLDWNEVRKNDIGIELRFGSGIAVDLLQKLLKLEGDLLFLNDRIDRIWIFKTTDTEEIRTFFFSSEEGIVYESVRADLTVRDVQDYVGFGQHLPEYTMMAGDLYLPKESLQATSMIFPFETYSPEQMQRSLFFDASTTRAIVDRSGSQIFADGKRGLQVDQNGLWINYTNPAATQSNGVMPSENVYASVDFINEHGGWDGSHALTGSPVEDEMRKVTFRKYVEQYPIIDNELFNYGNIQLTLQQGVVTEYSRSLITLAEQSESRTVRWLAGGEALKGLYHKYARQGEVTALFPALRSSLLEDNRISFEPVWAVRLADGTEEILTEAYPIGYKPPPPQTDEASNGQGAGDGTSPGQTTGEVSDSQGTEASDGSESAAGQVALNSGGLRSPREQSGNERQAQGSAGSGSHGVGSDGSAGAVSGTGPDDAGLAGLLANRLDIGSSFVDQGTDLGTAPSDLMDGAEQDSSSPVEPLNDVKTEAAGTVSNTE
ncbi:YycH family regulatory protein [Paenibacillus sp. strain BS8-2]